MKLEFQEELLRFFIQHKAAKKYVEAFDKNIFELITHETIFGLLKDFIKKYKGYPSCADMLEFFRTQLKAQKGEKITQQLVDMMENAIRAAYDPFTGNVEYVRSTIVEEYQRKLLMELFKDQAKALSEKDPKAVADVLKKAQAIKKIGDENLDEVERNRGRYLLKDHKPGSIKQAAGKPSYLKGLNRMRGTGGFSTGELYLMMMPPKGFKTGTCLSLSLGFMRDGGSEYYADTENGHEKLNLRMQQAMSELTALEVLSGEHDELIVQLINKYKIRGGDFVADYFPMHTKDMNDVDLELERRRDEDGFIPTEIFFDNLDNFKPIDKSIKEKRHQITAVYADALRLLSKWDCIGFSPSQVNRNAVNKAILDMTAFAEDFMKAANCHGAWAMCQDGVEKIAWIARILPVVQREGVDQDSGAACYVSLDKARMQIKEISYDEWKTKYEKAKPEFEKKKGITATGKRKSTAAEGFVATAKTNARGVKKLSDD